MAPRSRIVVQEECQLARLYDPKQDGPGELTVVRVDDDTVACVIENRDAGTQSNSVHVDAAQLVAAVHLLTASRFTVEP